MRMLLSMLFSAGLAVMTGGRLLAMDCEFCQSGEVYCSVVQDFSEQYTEDAQVACEEDRDLLIDIHAFDLDSDECDSGIQSFRNETPEDGLGPRFAAVAGGGEGWDCKACGYESDCHT